MHNSFFFSNKLIHPLKNQPSYFINNKMNKNNLIIMKKWHDMTWEDKEEKKMNEWMITSETYRSFDKEIFLVTLKRYWQDKFIDIIKNQLQN
jgi:hypothetical protein